MATCAAPAAAAAAAAVVTAATAGMGKATAAVGTFTTVTTMEQRQRPLRGISIIIESEEAAQPAEMSLKSQTMLLASGDTNNIATSNSNNNNNNGNKNSSSCCSKVNVAAMQPQDDVAVSLNVAQASKADFETSYATAPLAVAEAEAEAVAEATKLAATTTKLDGMAAAAKLYPQLLLRIGQAADAGEIVVAEASTNNNNSNNSTTIISCNNEVEKGVRQLNNHSAEPQQLHQQLRLYNEQSNVVAVAAVDEPSDDVRNVLWRPVGEIEQPLTALSNSNSNSKSIAVGSVCIASQAAVEAAESAALAESSAVTETVGISAPKDTQQHTVKIQIASPQPRLAIGKQISVVKLNDEQGIPLPAPSSSSSSLSSSSPPTPSLLSPSALPAASPSPLATATGTGTGTAMVVQQPSIRAAEEAANEAGSTPTPPSSYQLCYLSSSGQYSPCETLDSGTGSDLESVKSPTAIDEHLNGSSNSSVPPKLKLHLKTTKIRVNTSSNGQSQSQANGSESSHLSPALHVRAYSLTDSEECDESSSSLSCDSLHSNEYVQQSPAVPLKLQQRMLGALLPDTLLRDIRDRERDREEERARECTDARKPSYETLSSSSLEPAFGNGNANTKASNEHGNDFPLETPAAAPAAAAVTRINGRPLKYEADQYYTFHVNEHANFRSFGNGNASSSDKSSAGSDSSPDYETHSLQYNGEEGQDDAFAGYRDVRYCSQLSTIRSSKGTVRGVKNRVRNGVATFLQLQQPNLKNYKEKDAGKVVLYTTSMGIIRETYAKCANVKQILRTLLIKFEERDIFMSVEYQQEMRDRMHDENIRVPQLFVEGQHIGDADTVERLNETGELRQLLKPYKTIAATHTCQTCGGYRLLPCPSCNGSKKSVHRNHFTAEFVALKCMNCDEVGLVKCQNC